MSCPTLLNGAREPEHTCGIATDGTAGRDGNQSWCRLLWLKEDLRLATAMAPKPGTPNVSQSRDYLRAKKAGLKTMRE